MILTTHFGAFTIKLWYVNLFPKQRGFGMCDSICKKMFAPFLLRLGLATIFIFHGYHMVHDPGNEWGAQWDRTASEERPAPDQLEIPPPSNRTETQEDSAQRQPLPTAVQVAVACGE